jgi:acetyl-CoA acetyltransferase
MLSQVSRRLSTSSRSVVFVDGCRTPFKTSGTDFKDYIAQDLGRIAMKGLLTRTAIDPAEISYTLYGTVIQEGAALRATLSVFPTCRLPRDALRPAC